MEINFGNVKPLRPVTDFEEGVYTLRIESWECLDPKKPESVGNGKNLKIKFSLVELEGAPPMWCNVWLDFKNPWGAKLFFEALFNREIGEDDSVPDPEDADYYVGEKVRCALQHESYDFNGKSGVKWSPTGPDAWLPAA